MKYAVSYEVGSTVAEELCDTRTHTLYANGAKDAAVRVAQLRNQPGEYYVQELPGKHGEVVPVGEIILYIITLLPLPVPGTPGADGLGEKCVNARRGCVFAYGHFDDCRDVIGKVI